MIVPLGHGLTAPLRETARAKRTWYGLTNRRLLIVEAGWRRSVKTIEPSQLKLERPAAQSCQGDLILYRDRTARSEGYRSFIVAFWGIDNVAEVERLIRETLQRAN